MQSKLSNILTILILLSIFVPGCCPVITKLVIVPPPFPKKPLLESMTIDKNDATKESGFWMNKQDAKETAGYFMKLEVLEREWKPNESNKNSK